MFSGQTPLALVTSFVLRKGGNNHTPSLTGLWRGLNSILHVKLLAPHVLVLRQVEISVSFSSAKWESQQYLLHRVINEGKLKD